MAIHDVRVSTEVKAQEQTHFLTTELFTDAVEDNTSVDPPSSFDAPYVREAQYKPLVMNPESGSIMYAKEL
jgi:hypothetical protein